MSGGPRWRRGATAFLVVLVALQAGAALAQGAPPGPGEDRRPRVSRGAPPPTTGLSVSIDTISPAYLTPGESQEVRGVITNLDDHVWRDLQVYLVMSPSPLTAREQLAAALASPATLYSGNRVTEPGRYLELGSLEPGESASYDLDVPFGQLGLITRAAGVYPMGVHVIATDESGFRNSAEATGRARSFIPLMPERVDAPVDLSLVWPFQAPVQRAADGTYLNADDLTGEVSSGGHLRRMLDMAQAAGSVPLTLVVDPAVLDALSHIADGSTCENPARTQSAGDGPTPTDGEGATPPEATDPVPEPSSEQRSAQEFVRDLLTVAQSQPVWTQGFGRPDLAALTSRPRTGLTQAIDGATAASLAAFDLSGRRVYLPTQTLDPSALAKLAPDTVTLVSADQLPGWQLEDGPVAPLGTTSPVDVLVADRSLTDGGPAPGPTDTALQVRQRLLSESALLSLEATATGESDAGIVFVASPAWDPGPVWPSAGFFTGLDAPWLETATLDSQLARGPLEPATGSAPATAAPQTLPPTLLDTAAGIVRRARVLRAVAGDDPTMRTCSDQSVALAVSEYWRNDPTTGQALADDVLATLSDKLALITVEGPDFVTLSSSSGRFPITISNGLDKPVRVGVRITADDGTMTFDDIGPVDLRSNESTTLTVRTQAADVGVISVTATLITPTGKPFGKRAPISLRTSVVGVIVWIALGAATGLVVLAIARRVRRRGRGLDAGTQTPPLRTSP